MVFSGIPFLFFFLPAAVILYFLFPVRYRNAVLLGINLVFYLLAAPLSLPVLLALIAVNFLCGLSINRFRKKKELARIPLFVGIAVNIILLIILKYQFFLPGGADHSIQTENLFMDILIPIGISVYTLQGVSYLIDLYYHKVKVQKRLVPFAMYLSMFPQMICGPIVRYSDIAESIQHRQMNANTISKGYNMFIRGLSKKLILGDTMLELWNTVKAMEYETMPVLTAWLGVAGFAFAVYFYFSGYSDMARGIAKILGFDFPMNFNAPYTAKSLTGFWRRWNISLTVWCKSYVISPLGKRYTNVLATLLKLLVLWTLMGLWYGGGWNFLLWGLIFGGLIAVEQLFLSPILEKLPGLIRRIYTIVVVFCMWLVFGLQDLTRVLAYYKAMFTGNAASWSQLFSSGSTVFADGTSLYLLGSYAVVLILCIFAGGTLVHNIGLRCEHKSPRAALVLRIACEIFLTLVCLVAVAGGNGADTSFFVYF